MGALRRQNPGHRNSRPLVKHACARRTQRQPPPDPHPHHHQRSNANPDLRPPRHRTRDPPLPATRLGIRSPHSGKNVLDGLPRPRRFQRLPAKDDPLPKQRIPQPEVLLLRKSQPLQLPAQRCALPLHGVLGRADRAAVLRVLHLHVRVDFGDEHHRYPQQVCGAAHHFVL